jgi:hypothetical protein
MGHPEHAMGHSATGVWSNTLSSIIKEMKQRLQSVLTLLLACLVLGAGTQGAVCELACGLGGKVPCHGTVVAPAKRASMETSMAGMHCSGMKRSDRSDAAPSGVQFDGRVTGLCRHSLPVAMATSDPAGERVEAVHWVVLEQVEVRPSVAAYRFIANLKAPPLLSTVDSLILPLRV